MKKNAKLSVEFCTNRFERISSDIRWRVLPQPVMLPYDELVLWIILPSFLCWDDSPSWSKSWTGFGTDRSWSICSTMEWTVLNLSCAASYSPFLLFLLFLFKINKKYWVFLCGCVVVNIHFFLVFMCFYRSSRNLAKRMKQKMSNLNSVCKTLTNSW